MTHTKATQVAYIEHRGSFSSVPWEEDMRKLYGYAKAHKLRPAMHPMGIYHDNPATVPESELRSEVALPVKGRASPEGEIHVKALPEMDVAVMKFQGPATEFAAAYAQIRSWVEAHGFVQVGSPIEIYRKKPKVVGGKREIAATIEFPVGKR